MRFYSTVLSFLIVMLVASSAFGERNASPNQAAFLANEVGAKVIYPGSTVLVTGNACLLHISFESVRASFDVPLQGASVIETDSEDAIIVKSKSMTRTIKDRAPETFEYLTLRFNRSTIKSVMKSFNEAIEACNAKGTTLASVN